MQVYVVCLYVLPSWPISWDAKDASQPGSADTQILGIFWQVLTQLMMLFGMTSKYSMEIIRFKEV